MQGTGTSFRPMLGRSHSEKRITTGSSRSLSMRGLDRSYSLAGLQHTHEGSSLQPIHYGVEYEYSNTDSEDDPHPLEPVQFARASQKPSFAKRISKTLKGFGSSFSNVSFSNRPSKFQVKASRKSYDHVIRDFDVERGRFNSEEFEMALQAIHPLEVISREEAIKFKELMEDALAQKEKNAGKTKSKGIMRSFGRDFRKMIKKEKITGPIKIVALDIGTNNIGASVLEVDLETLRENASENKIIDMEEYVYALAGFGRTENKNFLKRIAEEIQPHIYIIGCSLTWENNFEDFGLYLEEISKFDFLKKKKFLIGNEYLTSQMVSRSEGIPGQQINLLPYTIKNKFSRNDGQPFQFPLKHLEDIKCSILVMRDTLCRAGGWKDQKFGDFFEQKYQESF